MEDNQFLSSLEWCITYARNAASGDHTPLLILTGLLQHIATWCSVICSITADIGELESRIEVYHVDYEHQLLEAFQKAFDLMYFCDFPLDGKFGKLVFTVYANCAILLLKYGNYTKAIEVLSKALQSQHGIHYKDIPTCSENLIVQVLDSALDHAKDHTVEFINVVATIPALEASWDAKIASLLRTYFSRLSIDSRNSSKSIEAQMSAAMFVKARFFDDKFEQKNSMLDLLEQILIKGEDGTVEFVLQEVCHKFAEVHIVKPDGSSARHFIRRDRLAGKSTFFRGQIEAKSAQSKQRLRIDVSTPHGRRWDVVDRVINFLDTEKIDELTPEIALETLQVALDYGVDVLPGLLEAYMSELISEKIYRSADIAKMTKIVFDDRSLDGMITLKQSLVNASAQQFVLTCQQNDLDAIIDHFSVLQLYTGIQASIAKLIKPVYRELVDSKKSRVVEFLWENKLLPDDVDPIVDALRSGDDDFAAHLIRIGVPLRKDMAGMLAELIDWSLRENKVDVVAIVIKFLQDQNLVDTFVNLKIKDETILVRTSRVPDPSNFVLNFLLDNKAHPTQGALIAAAEAGNPFGVRRLLQAGVRPDVKLPRTSVGYTLVQWAAKHGHLDVLELCIERGADVFWNDPHGTTALTLATRNRHTAVSEFLQAKGCSIKTPLPKQTPFRRSGRPSVSTPMSFAPITLPPPPAGAPVVSGILPLEVIKAKPKEVVPRAEPNSTAGTPKRAHVRPASQSTTPQRVPTTSAANGPPPRSVTVAQRPHAVSAKSAATSLSKTSPATPVKNPISPAASKLNAVASPHSIRVVAQEVAKELRSSHNPAASSDHRPEPFASIHDNFSANSSTSPTVPSTGTPTAV